MNIIISPAASGKTYKLINLCDGFLNFQIVCDSKRACARVSRQARKMKVTINPPISFYDFLDGEMYGSQVDTYLFDDADSCLQSIARHRIHTITLTGDIGMPK